MNILKSVENASLPWVSQSKGLLSPAYLERVFERISCPGVCNFNDPARGRIWGGHREACPLHNQVLTVKNCLWGLNDMSIFQPFPTLALKIIQENLLYGLISVFARKSTSTLDYKGLYAQNWICLVIFHPLS